ncbi:unnamed protein product, partial [Amoebophrya sp. A120]
SNKADSSSCCGWFSFSGQSCCLAAPRQLLLYPFYYLFRDDHQTQRKNGSSKTTKSRKSSRPKWMDSIVLKYCPYWRMVLYPCLLFHQLCRKNTKLTGWRVIYLLDFLAIWVTLTIQQPRLFDLMHEFYFHSPECRSQGGVGVEDEEVDNISTTTGRR